MKKGVASGAGSEFIRQRYALTLLVTQSLYTQVPELKAALESLGLETKGLKAELVSRLKAASNKPAYDPNEPTDDNDQETPVEVEN